MRHGLKDAAAGVSVGEEKSGCAGAASCSADTRASTIPGSNPGWDITFVMT